MTGFECLLMLLEQRGRPFLEIACMATITYDPLFQKYAARFFLAVQIDGKPFDWRWLHAQAMAESGLDPRAHSPAGAMGLMQLMPATFSECVSLDRKSVV